ncbi:hypothetical protein Mapa_001974 [Marchantia paleacea]|nr:hypothetical protein Mapa_001974 [Marchantia paleacea]
MNSLLTKLVHQLQNAGGNGGLPHTGHVGERTKGGLVLEHYAIQLWDIELIRTASCRDIVAKPLPTENRLRDVQNSLLNL